MAGGQPSQGRFCGEPSAGLGVAYDQPLPSFMVGNTESVVQACGEKPRKGPMTGASVSQENQIPWPLQLFEDLVLYDVLFGGFVLFTVLFGKCSGL